MKTILRLLAALLLAGRALALDATLDGRITDAVTFAGIEGATITVEPVVPGDSLAAESDPFGFYKKSAIPPASYTLKVRHPAYLDHDEPLTLGSGAKATRDVALTPRWPGVVTIDIFTQVFCTRTMMELRGVPVRIERYSALAAPTPDETFYRTTDADGGFILRGARTGFYTFRFNHAADGAPRAKWDALDKPEKKHLDSSYAAVAQLLPQGQTADFSVRGLDAVHPENPPGPLDKVYAELTGVRHTFPPGFVPGVDDPEPYETTVLPTRTGETGALGRVRSGPTFGFTALPALAQPYEYKLRLKRFGYREKTIYFSADAAGLLPAFGSPITLDFEVSTIAEVNVKSEQYTSLDLLEGVKVRLQGIDGSNTAGINREMTVSRVLGDPAYPAGVMRAVFGTLLPGRYRVSVDSQTLSPDVLTRDGLLQKIAVRFRGNDVVDVALAKSTASELKVTAEPATIRGRLFAANERSSLTLGAAEIQDPFHPFRGPRYGPRAQAGIMFSESALAPFLAAGLKVVSFDTDAAGRFVAKVLPGVYGCKIPTMTDYFGSDFDWHNVTTGEAVRHGWCYDVDPLAAPDFSLGVYHSLGAPVSSGDEIALDLYVRKQRYYLLGHVEGDRDNPLLAQILANPNPDPTRSIAVTIPFSELARGGGLVRLNLHEQPLAQDCYVFAPTGIRKPSIDACYQFDLVPPGTHTLTFETANHTIRHNSTGETSLTVILPDWGFPGAVAAGDVIPLTFPFPEAWSAEYNGTDTVRFRFFNRVDNEDVLITERTNPDYFKVDNLGVRLFQIASSPFLMRTGSWTLWVYSYDDKWYKRVVNASNTGAEHVFNIHVDRDAPMAPPAQTYKLEVQALVDADRTHRIGGVAVDFGDVDATGDPVLVTTTAGGFTTILNRTTDFVPLSATHSTWAYWNYDADFRLDGDLPVITISVRMTRGMRVSGTLSVAGFPLSRLAGIDVGITNRYGNRIATLVTDADGVFDTPEFAISFAEAGFIDINHPGFYPARVRFEPDDSGGPGSPATVTLALALTPYERPDILNASIDRRGPFLPGVSKSGDASLFAPDPDLEGEFSLLAEAKNVTISLPNYDAGDGSPGGSSVQTIADEVSDIMLVDPRSFPSNPLYDPPDPFPPPNLSEAQFHELMRAWFNAAVGAGSAASAKPNMFVSRSDTYTGGANPLQMTGAGKVPLWKLPPGQFKPVAVVRTRNGAWNYTLIQHTGVDDYQQLTGLALPPWAAGIADILGTVNALQDLTPDVAKAAMKKIMPEGLLKALPSINSATITKNASGFLKYEYSLGCEIEDGMELPGTGWLGMLPGFEGFSVNGDVTFTLDGGAMNAGQPRWLLALQARAGGEVELEPDIEDFIPKSVPKRLREQLGKKVEVAITLFGSTAATANKYFIGEQTLELDCVLSTFGSVEGEFKFDITDIVEKLPQVGQVITTLNAIDEDAIKVTANLGALIGVGHTGKFSTKFPRLIEFGGGTVALDPTPHPLRRHFLGGGSVETAAGNAQVSLDTAFYLYVSLGLGVDLFDGTAGASGSIRLTGAERHFPQSAETKPSMKFTVNRLGDWPLIERVEGALTGALNVYLKVWKVKLEKEWEWELIKIDHQFTTAPSFDLARINITTRTSTIGGGTPASYSGLAPQLLRGLFSLSDFATSSAAGDLLAFVDIDPATGSMVLKIARRTGISSFGTPVTVASAGAVLRPQLVALSGGGAMLVWTEISAADAADLTPPSTLRFATSPDGLAWSAPATIASLSGVAVDSRLFAMPGGAVGLVFLETNAGPGSNSYAVKATLHSAAAWGSVQSLLGETVLRGFDAAGSSGTAPAEVVYVDAANALRTFTWDGAATSAPVTLAASDAASPLALTSGPGDTFVLGAGRVGGAGIGLFKKIAPGAWSPLGSAPLPALGPQSLTLLPTTSGAVTHYLAAWTGGAAPATISYAWVDAAGAILAGPFDLTETVAGAYDSLRAVAHAGTHEATLFAHFDNGTGLLELRTFDVSLAAGSINHDRDLDVLDDRDELRIVDASTTDGIVTIDDVLPTADFDGDGFTNATELAVGTDPTNDASFPGQLVGAEVVVAVCHEFGTVPGRVVIFREGNANVPLTVHYAMSGGATNGTDYATLSGTLTLPAGIYSSELEIAPLGDTLAEGSETATLTLVPDGAYSISAASSAASVTINDLPMDEWRFANFTAAELLDAAISGDLSDAEADGLFNLLEYGFALPPKTPDAAAAIPVALFNGGTGETHLGLIYVRRAGALDLVFENEISEDLAIWRAAGSEVQIVSVTPNGDGTETVVIRDSLPVTSHDLRFLRVKVRRHTP